MGVHGECVCLEHVALGVDDLGLGHLGAVFRLDDDFLAQTRLLVGVDAVGDVLDKVLVTELTGHLADDNGVEGVPFADYVTLLHGITVLVVEFRAVGDVGRCEHHAGLGVEDAHLGQTADDNLDGTSVGADFVGCDGAELLDLKLAFVARGDGRYGRDVRGHTTDVERTQCKLCTRLTD